MTDQTAEPAAPSAADGTAAPRDRIVDAFVGRLATTPFGEIELADVARDAGVALSELRLLFDGRMGILAAFTRRIDAAVLDRQDPALAAEPARDRLFDILMARLDVLTPYRAAVAMLSRSIRRDPLLAAALNPLGVRSMSFMLIAAGIPAAGAAGTARAQALAVAWAQILPVWVEDEDPGLARTMVAVDKALSRGERLEGLMCRVRDAACRMGDRFASRRSRRERTQAGPGVAGEGI